MGIIVSASAMLLVQVAKARALRPRKSSRGGRVGDHARRNLPQKSSRSNHATRKFRGAAGAKLFSTNAVDKYVQSLYTLGLSKLPVRDFAVLLIF